MVHPHLFHVLRKALAILDDHYARERPGVSAAPAATETEFIKLRDECRKKALARFLAWKLPATFRPDCGISFDGRGKDARGFDKGWPVGTNLFTADEAQAMFEHCLAIEP